MRTFLATIICLSLFVVAVRAEPVIQFYYSKMSCEEADTESYNIPPEYGDGAMPAAALGETVYLWGRTTFQDYYPWNSVSLYFTGDVTSGEMHDGIVCCCYAKCWVDRWEGSSDFDPATDDNGSDGYDDIYLDRGDEWGLAGNFPDKYTVLEDETWEYMHICIGSMTWNTLGYQWISNDTGLTLREGFTTSDLYFGFNPDGTPEYAGAGEVAHTTSTRADIFIATEPGGDVNCDGSVNSLDIDAFVLVVTGTPPDYPGYYAQHPDCNHILADCNEDGSINSLDIDPFVEALTGN